VTSAKRNSLASVNFELCTKVLCVVFGDWGTSKGYVLSLMLSIEGLCVVFDERYIRVLCVVSDVEYRRAMCCLRWGRDQRAMCCL
jgi:K+ transporter